MEEGRLYPPGDEEIMERQFACLEKLYDFNDTRPSELAKRQELLREMFGAIGEGCYIEPPLHSNWGGRHVHFGRNVYANFNLTLVDDGHIYVGDAVMFGPNVTELRRAIRSSRSLGAAACSITLTCILETMYGLVRVQ